MSASEKQMQFWLHAVREIRSAPKHTKGVCPALAKRFGVSLGTIYQVRSGASWKDVA